MAENKAVYLGTGRRKNAVARVRLVPGTGVSHLNKKPALEYFGREALVTFATTPFKVTETVGPLRRHRHHRTAAASPVRPARCATASLARCSRPATSTVASSRRPASCAATRVWSSARSTA